ncbi:MAG: type II toxin-antitoxin system RelE/ParE family toxin [Planctomycetes bacterium]|nr:type II toxin-antitoxin system RelE/ParE family toxin [Planctomycetota bacterium]
MTWTVVFHPKVLEKDLPRIPRAEQEKIVRAIERRLGLAPESYGKPLRPPLSAFRRLRVGDYRVIYRVERSRVIVQVLCVGIRRDAEVYAEAARRLGTP